VLSLLGNASETVEKGSSYSDAGATALDYNGVDLTSSIVTVNLVSINIVGTYVITYNVSDTSGNAASQVSRLVTVEDTQSVDTTAPVVTLNGDSEVSVANGTVYTELGALAFDNNGTVDLTSSIVIDDSQVDTSVSGTYTVTYTVTDASGNSSTPVTRTVIVLVAPASAICFPAGTMVETDQGHISIERLVSNVHTIDDVKVLHVTSTCPFPWIRQLVQINRDALGSGVPNARVLLSPAHQIQYEGEFVRAESLLMLPGVELSLYTGDLLFNVLLPHHGTISVCGMLCETLSPCNLVAQIMLLSPASVRASHLQDLNVAVRANDASAYACVCESVRSLSYFCPPSPRAPLPLSPKELN